MDWVAPSGALGHGASHAAPRERIGALDALRGFAIFGMLLTHMSDQFIGGPLPTHAFSSSPLDLLAQAGVDTFVRGKAFALFSVLFGVSFFLQIKSAAKVQPCVACWVGWRMLLLLLIGMVHHLFWSGDVLTLYAVGGVLLLLARRWSNTALVGLACFFLFGGVRFLVLALQAATGWDLEFVQTSAARQAAYLEVLKASSLPDVFAQNYWHGWPLKLQFLFGVQGRAYQTLGLFLLGLLVARGGWHERALSQPRLLYQALGGAGVLGAVAALGLLLVGGNGSAANLAVRRTLIDAFNLAAATATLGVFLLLYLRTATTMAARVVAAIGRAGLTSYVTETLMGTFIMYGWGLGMLGCVGPAQAVALAVLVFALQAAVATWWFGWFRYGPLEWAWRVGSYRRWEPILKAPHAH
jgi:uncharacterized protein